MESRPPTLISTAKLAFRRLFHDHVPESDQPI